MKMRDTLSYQLPANLSVGEHTIRVSLRAPDHHALNIEHSITVVVE